MIDLYRKNGDRIASIMIDSGASIKRKMMEDAKLSCTLATNKRVDIRRGDYLEADGERFHVFDIPKEKKNSNGEFVYECELYSISRMMKDVLFLFLDKDVDNRIVQSTIEYDLTATLSEFMGLLVGNMNRVDNGWSYSVSEINPKKMENISVDGSDCASILKSLMEKFDAEFQIIGKEIKVAPKIQKRTSIEFSYPKNLLSPFQIKRGDNDEACTRLYVFGGNRNIPSGYNEDKTDRLIMPGGKQYLERSGAATIIEKVKKYDDIYPRRNSYIQTVSRSQGGFYYVCDPSIDFDINGQLNDNVAKIAFTDGLLVGYEFEIASFDYTSKRIEIKQQMDNGVTIPNETICPRPGDPYVLLDIELPSSYIVSAEKELEDKAKEYFDNECNDEIETEITPSQIWLKKNGITLNPGDVVNIKDGDLDIDEDIRIEAVTLYPFNNREQKVELANYTKKSKLERLESALNANSEAINASSSAINNYSFVNRLLSNLNDSTIWQEMED